MPRRGFRRGLVAYLFRYREISMQSNSRYSNALAQVDDPGAKVGIREQGWVIDQGHGSPAPRAGSRDRGLQKGRGPHTASNLARTVAERLANLQALQRLAEEARRAGHRGRSG